MKKRWFRTLPEMSELNDFSQHGRRRRTFQKFASFRSVISNASSLPPSPTMALFLVTLCGMLVFADSSRPLSSKLTVQIPHSLYKEGGYDHRVALFGVPRFGGSIAQNVYYADSTFCQAEDIDPSKGYPRRDDRSPWRSPFILMVDRGDCSFVQKVRNAQHAGAAGVVIADNTCLCMDADCISDPGEMCVNDEPVLADDGSGTDVSIPSFLIFKKDADTIKNELREDRPVLIEMKWNLPSPYDRVEYSLWTTPTDTVSHDFLLNFKTLAVALGDRAYFTPHQYIHDGITSHCNRKDKNEGYCYNLCTNHGRYCAPNPDSTQGRGISGANVVKESLRRSCIWRYYGSPDGIGAKWWDYIIEFVTRCSDPDYFANQDCIDDVYRHANVDGERIEQCMRDSGGVHGDNSNIILDAEIDYQKRNGVVIVPTVFVDAVAIRDQLTPSNLFRAICSRFPKSVRPVICSIHDGCLADNGGSICPSSSTPSSGAGNGISRRMFAGIILLLFVTAFSFGLALWCHMHARQKDESEKIRKRTEECKLLKQQDAKSPSGANDMDHMHARQKDESEKIRKRTEECKLLKQQNAKSRSGANDMDVSEEELCQYFIVAEPKK